MFRVVFAAMLMACLTACASVPNPIPQAARGGFFVKDAPLSWSVPDQQQSKDTEYLAGKADLTNRLQAAVMNEFRTSPSGSEAVSFKIDVTHYSRVGAMVGNILGGSNFVAANVTVVRQSDGQVLGVYKGVFGMYASNGGVIGAIAQSMTKPDIVGIMANNFADRLRRRFDRD